MKNRTIIGIVCILLAVVVAFGVAPVVNQATSDDNVSVVMLKNNLAAGDLITSTDVILTSVNKSAVPSGAIYDTASVVGMYAKTDLYSGDFITSAKIQSTEQVSSAISTASDVFVDLDGSKIALSFPVSNFSASLSGKLQNGDIISCIVTDSSTGEVIIPEALQYIQVITTTTSDGVDKDSVVVEDDGSYTSPSTITVLVTPYQATLLTMYQNNGTITCALVYRGDSETAQSFIDMQDAYLEMILTEDEEDENNIVIVVDNGEQSDDDAENTDAVGDDE